MDGKTVIFTGWAGNLGQVLVKALLEYGAKVAVPDIADRFDETFDEYKANDKLFFIKADLSQTDDIKRVFAEIENHFGKIDVLVNCAAYGGGAGGKAAEFRKAIYRIPTISATHQWDGTTEFPTFVPQLHSVSLSTLTSLLQTEPSRQRLTQRYSARQSGLLLSLHPMIV